MERDQFNPHDVRSESFAQRYLKSSIYLLRTYHVRFLLVLSLWIRMKTENAT